MKALILAGGYGKRLLPYTNQIPKPLIEIKEGYTILDYIIDYLKNFGIRDIIFAVGYLKEKIIEKVGSGEKYGINAIYVIEDIPKGTEGALYNAKPILEKEDYFIVINGDIVTNLNINKLIESLGDNYGVISLVRMKSPYGVVELEGNKIKKFLEKPELDYWINAGVYVFKPEIFKYIKEEGNFEYNLLPKLAEMNKLVGVKFENVFWKSIDNVKDLEEVRKKLQL